MSQAVAAVHSKKKEFWQINALDPTVKIHANASPFLPELRHNLNDITVDIFKRGGTLHSPLDNRIFNQVMYDRWKSDLQQLSAGEKRQIKYLWGEI